MQAGTKTELNPQNHDHSLQNSEIHELERSSKNSERHPPTHQPPRGADLSQGPHPRRSLDNLDYKRQLVKLMVSVMLEESGIRQGEVNALIDFELAAIEDLESIEGRQLGLHATDAYLRVISTVLGEGSLRAGRRVASENSHSEQRGREVNLEVVPVERMEEMEARPRREGPEILCNICYTTSALYCEEECGHTFCIECMKGYLRENLRSGNYIIKCPEYDCPDHISVDIVKMVLNDRELDRFLYFRDKNEKEMNPDNKFCSKPDCGELLDKAHDRLRCPKCHSTYCEICLQGYHSDDPCDIVLRNSLENTYKSFQIKKCPSCKSPIEKSEGCNHMTCKKCKFQFCWLCLKKYSRHHYKYYNCLGCPGMQFEDEEEAVAERFKQLLFYFLMPFIVALVLFCYLAAVPLYMLGSFVYKPCGWADEDRNYLEEWLVKNLCCCLGTCLSKMLLWLLYQPRAALYAVFLAPIKLTMMFCGQVCKIFQ